MCDLEDFKKPEDKLLEKKLPFSPHFLTPAGMLLPKHQQPPPMYGPRGTTIPPQFIPKSVFASNNTLSGVDTNQFFNYRTPNINTQPNYRGRGRGRGGRGGGSSHPRKPFNNEAVLPPRNWDLWCESCDRDFPSKDLLDKHKSEHKTCGIDGCKFVGHPLVVEKHVNQQHESGLFDKLKNLETPEDITKWREERRRKYPTQANIELKQKARDARRDRGEKLEQPNPKFNRNPKQKQANRRNNRKNKPGADASKRPSNQKTQPSSATDPDEVNQGIVMFKGTRGMWDEEETLETQTDKSDEEIVATNPLLKLIGMYSDDSDVSEDEQKAAGTITSELLSSPVPEIPACNDQVALVIPPVTAEEMPKDIERPKSNERVETKPSSSGKRKHNNTELLEDTDQPHVIKKKGEVIKSGLNYSSLKRAKPNTLLFKLLQGEIRHERNLLLQAVRFVIQNNFFDKEDL